MSNAHLPVCSLTCTGSHSLAVIKFNNNCPKHYYHSTPLPGCFNDEALWLMSHGINIHIQFQFNNLYYFQTIIQQLIVDYYSIICPHVSLFQQKPKTKLPLHLYVKKNLNHSMNKGATARNSSASSSGMLQLENRPLPNSKPAIAPAPNGV